MSSALHSDRNLQSWLDEYGESHRHPVNIVLHKICVPLILWSLLGLFFGMNHHFSRGLGFILVLGGMVFYFRLGLRPFFGMLAAVIFCLASFYVFLQQGLPLFTISLVVFVLAWIGQFVGHKFEGKKPSFFQDLQFLLVGPLWVVFYRRS